MNTYLSFLKLLYRLVDRVESRLPNRIDLLHPREDSLELGLKHRHHVLGNEGDNRHRLKIRLILRQSLFSANFEAAVLDRQVRVVDARLQDDVSLEVDVAKIEASGGVFEGDHDERGLDGAIDELVGGRLLATDTFEKGVEMGRLGVAELIAQDQSALLWLVQLGEGGRVNLHDDGCAVLGVKRYVGLSWMSTIQDEMVSGRGWRVYSLQSALCT
jgi:hypothetical protein